MPTIQPGIGWGAALIGASYDELVRAFGEPTERLDFEAVYFPGWHSLGLQVHIPKRTGTVDLVFLYGIDPDSKQFAVADAVTELGARFGCSPAELVALHGIARQAVTGTDSGVPYVRLVYPGVEFRFVDDRLVRIAIDRPAFVAVPRSANNPELEAAICANPDDVGPYLVYADWLQQQGDLRGELITLQAARLRSPTDRELAVAEHDFIAEHRTDLLGPLADYDDMLPVLEWHLGFIRRVRVANTLGRSPEHDAEDEEVPVEDVLAMLLESDNGPFVQDITVGIVTFSDNSYDTVIATLGARPRPSLRTLFLGDFDREETELNWSHLGDASGMYAALPNLRSLTLRSGTMTLGAIVLPELRDFATLTGGLTTAEIVSIANAHWPKLEKLSLQLGAANFGCNVQLADLQPILDGDCCPATLRHLGIVNWGFADELVPLLAGSKILPRIRELDLSLGTLGASGAAALVKHADAFRHLERLDLSESYLDPERVAEVSRVLPNTILDDQRWDARYPDFRYIAAAE